MHEIDDNDEHSIVFVRSVNSPDLNRPGPRSSLSSGKRRSMSVGEADLKGVIQKTHSNSPLPRTPEKDDISPRLEDVTLNGILDDFKGELSQLDPISGSLDLRDPSTPSRYPALRSKTDSLILSHDIQEERPEVTKSKSTPTYSGSPTLTLHIPSLQMDESPKKDNPPSPIVPPRSSSLQISRSTKRPESVGSPRGTTSRHPTSPLRSRSGPVTGLSSPIPRDNSRLRTLHRSTASSSEPSLIPVGDNTGNREDI